MLYNINKESTSIFNRHRMLRKNKCTHIRIYTEVYRNIDTNIFLANNIGSETTLDVANVTVILRNQY